MIQTISFQGEPGAYSHQACLEVFPNADVLPCYGFEAAIAAVTEGRADYAMLPVENSTYGRVADIHSLLPESGLHIVGEHFVRVHANLLGLKGSNLAGIKIAQSHPVLLGQCRKFLKKHSIESHAVADTAGSARLVSEQNEISVGALASELAADIYGLEILARHVEDNSHNTTRFLVCSPEATRAKIGSGKIMTTIVFQVRNIPAALYKAMGGFATNGVNMVKLESYMVNGSFTATQFYADVEGHPDEPALKRALEELEYFTSSMRILGVYPSNPFRESVS